MNTVLRSLGAVGLAFGTVCVLEGQAPPMVTSVSPTSAYNYAATTITITGTGFQSGATVKLGVDTLTATFVNSTTLTATVPSKLPAGAYDLTVAGPGGQSATKSSAFTARSSRGGHLGPWSGVLLPSPALGSSLLFIRDPYVYFFVAATGSAGSTNTIMRGTIQTDGSLAQWQSFAGPGTGGVGAVPEATTDGRYVWLVRAGQPQCCGTPRGTIDWAPVGADGTLGAWTQVTVPFTKSEFGFVATRGYLFAIGSLDSGSSSADLSGTNTTLRAPIGSDGAPGPWIELTARPLLGRNPSESNAGIIGSSLFCGVDYRFIDLTTGVGEAVFRSRMSENGDLAAWETVATDAYAIAAAPPFLYRATATRVLAKEIMSDGSLSSDIVTGSGFPDRATRFIIGGGRFRFRLMASNGFLYAAQDTAFSRAQISPLTLTGTAFAIQAGGLLELYGRDFLEGSTVSVDGVPLTDVTVNSMQVLTARVPAHAPGAATVTVTTPEGRSITSTTALIYDGGLPTGAVRVNGDAPITANRTVSLLLGASDDVSGVAYMALSNDGTTFSEFEPFLTTKTWTLSDSDGQRTVYVKFRDTAGNVGPTASDDITLDRRPPNGSMILNGGATSSASTTVRAFVSAAPGNSASVVGEVSFLTDGVTWGPWLAYSAAAKYDLALPAGDGLRTVYARFRDTGGNVSGPSEDSIRLDTGIGPGAVRINGHAEWTNSAAVSLALGGPVGAAEMQISSDPSFAGAVWEPYASRRSWTIAAGASGSRVVYARYGTYDVPGGTRQVTTVQDDINFDSVIPTGVVDISPSSTIIFLAASDDASGVAEMAVSTEASFIGAPWEPYVTSRAWSGGSPLVKFRDRAGNVSRVISLAGPRVQTAPFGSFDFPSDDAIVHGSLPVGGWALDDAAVTRVRIYRDSVAPEPPGEVFIGNAVFVDGARPDVAGLFPTLPSSGRGGWGLLVLTPVLPNSGTGTFTFSAYADDADGNSTLLGRRTVLAGNATATAPFGTIDTPSQGETISGTAYVNFGWVLTPQPKRIPIDGSTITVYIDGQPVGRPTYNVRREDVAGAFPSLANAGGAIGYLEIDTTRYADGLHTIGWTVVDDAGVAEGVGSRYFRIQNGPALRAASATPPSAAAPPVSAMLVDAGVCEPGSRTGHDPAADWQSLKGQDGAVDLATSESRIQLRFCAPVRAAYLVRDGKRDQLPVGASIDAAAGTFAWEPGPAFLGRFEFIFEHGGTRSSRVRISLLPKQ